MTKETRVAMLMAMTEAIAEVVHIPTTQILQRIGLILDEKLREAEKLDVML